MQITSTRNENTIQLTIDGRIDTNTSPQLQNEILTAFQKVNNVILEFEKVAYISSAGLRALLIGQKTALSKRGSMKLVHVQPMVMQVLKMSGFINGLNVEQ